jgi:urocanate hydratase
VTTLDEALRILKNAVRKKENVSVGLVGNCADIIPELAERGVVPDILTDQTSAHDPLNGYVPNGMTFEAALSCAKAIRRLIRSGRSMPWLARGRHAAAAEDGLGHV